MHLRLLLGLRHRLLGGALARGSLLEPGVDVPSVELPRPPRQSQRDRRRAYGHRRDDEERLPVAERAGARDALSGHRRHGALPRCLPVVHAAGDADVEDIGADGAGHVPDVVEGGVVLEAEELGDDGQDHRVRRPEAESDHHRRHVQRPRHAERDEEVSRHGEEEHACHQQRPRDAVVRQERLRGEAGGHAAEVVPDADEGDEGGDAALRVPQRLADLAHVVDGRQRPADAEHRRREQQQHVHAHQRLQDRVVLAARRRPQRGQKSRTRRRRRGGFLRPLLRGRGHRRGQNRRVSVRRGRVRDVVDERLGVDAAAAGAVEGEVELGEDGAAEPDKPLEETKHDAAALGEVLDAGDERAGVGERLRIRPDGDVEADEPERRRGADAAGDGEVEHEVAAEVHGGADGEDEPGRGYLGDEAGVDADVGADVLEEADGVELLLGVAQRGLDVLGVDGEDVGGAGRGHDEEGAVRHEPPPAQHLRRERRRGGFPWAGVVGWRQVTAKVGQAARQ
uniref:Uncharacterized protein n=1 Tax=Setaria italica TaxID=4555 RepID=K3Z5I4_SETIT